MARTEGILRLLIVDDSLTEADGVINTLRSAGYAVRASREDNINKLEQLLVSHTWDLLICRDDMADLPLDEIVDLIQRIGRDLPCLVLVNEPAAIDDLFNCGVQDIILRSDVKRFQFAVGRELTNLYLRRSSRRNERALRESDKRSRTLLKSSRDAVAFMHEGMHIYVNDAYLTLFGYDETEDVDGLPILDLIASQDQTKFKSIFRQFSEQAESDPDTVQVQCVKTDGSGFNSVIEFSHARVEGEDCTQVVIREDKVLSDNDSHSELLRDHDLLTGLYTRGRFMDELEKISFSAAEGKGDAELLYIVLDGFQAVKEQVGLGTSDVVIKSVADLLRKNMQEGEVLGRYGDQVFTVIITSDDDAIVDLRAESYRKTIADYASQADGKKIELKCSIGVSRVSENLTSAKVALENADRACVQAQKAGGNQVTRYRPSSHSSEQKSTEAANYWQQSLQDAIKKEKFKLHYQPIISLHGEPQEIYEVLLRLDVGDQQLITADEFIHHAIRLKMMAEIDKWIIRNALAALVNHRKEHPHTRFFIKVSEQMLYAEDYIDWLRVSLDAHDLDGNALVFEISETAALDNLSQTKMIISKLKELGCEFGLEHFGSGIDFSHSLSELDVDYLKINGTFVENMAHDNENQEAIKAITKMTKEAGKRCIAEFVSDANSLALLWRMDVDYAQGYYIHEPSDKLDYNFEVDEL